MKKRALGPQGLLYPTPVLLVGTYGPDGKANIMTAAWGGICCSRPPCIYVSLRPATLTHGSIVAGGCYTVSIPPEGLIREADYAGLASGRDVDKFQELGLTAVRGTRVNAPFVEECPVVLECRLVQKVELGSHTQFVGEVVEALADEDVLDANGLPDEHLTRPTVSIPATRHYYGLGECLGDCFSIGRRAES
ncbi:MAG: flavin reductase family protein [Chloroflexi bacterium]|nr:flavin reductase family protein [Chloroflexota bacterium]